MNKTRRKEVRFTDDEYKIMAKKAERYESISAYIRDAALNFNEKSGMVQILYAEEWAKLFVEYRSQISAIGNNINQLAHYANQCQKVGLIQDKVVEESSSLMREWLDIAKKFVVMDRTLRDSLKKS